MTERHLIRGFVIFTLLQDATNKGGTLACNPLTALKAKEVPIDIAGGRGGENMSAAAAPAVRIKRGSGDGVVPQHMKVQRCAPQRPQRGARRAASAALVAAASDDFLSDVSESSSDNEDSFDDSD